MWVQLPKCHSTAIHFPDLVVSAGHRRTRPALSESPLRQRRQVRPERRSVTGLKLNLIRPGWQFS